ncbi:MAG: O-methyltransferase [Lachnospiraceae bacterium]|nr:O-methyltransferase [Lachnospiraceae bacterium]
MILDERIVAFIQSMDKGNSFFLTNLEQEALAERIPIIRPDTQSLLRFLLTLAKPAAILEVGTAIGFSAILMAENTAAACRITTIENYEKRIPKARENFKASGYEEKITLLSGDAADILPGLTGPYDLIFMDAAKGQYIHFLPEVKRLLSPGGLLISDNVMQDGEILESRFAVERRNRTIHSRMREYLFALTHDETMETVILPVGDGVTLSVVKSGEEKFDAEEKDSKKQL